MCVVLLLNGSLKKNEFKLFKSMNLFIISLNLNFTLKRNRILILNKRIIKVAITTFMLIT